VRQHRDQVAGLAAAEVRGRFDVRAPDALDLLFSGRRLAPRRPQIHQPQGVRSHLPDEIFGPGNRRIEGAFGGLSRVPRRGYRRLPREPLCHTAARGFSVRRLGKRVKLRSADRSFLVVVIWLTMSARRHSVNLAASTSLEIPVLIADADCLVTRGHKRVRGRPPHPGRDRLPDPGK
jgi:hypothetical protein